MTTAKKTKTATSKPTAKHASLARGPVKYTGDQVRNLFATSDLYDKYRVGIVMRERIYGGTPRNPELFEAWVKARTGHDDELTKQQVEEVTEAMVDQVAEKTWIGFCRDEKHGLFIEARCIKALFRECSTLLRITTEKRGSKQILQHGFEVKATGEDADKFPPRSRIFLGKPQPDGTEERPIHVQTAMGPRTALKRADYVDGATLRFELWVLRTDAAESRHVGQAEVIEMLKLGQENGLGADRSQGNGKFDVVEFEVTQQCLPVVGDAVDMDAGPAKGAAAEAE